MRRRGENSAPGAERRQVVLKQFFDFGFVETCEFLPTLDEQGPFKEVRIFKHQFDRFVFGRWLLLHVLFSIERRPCIEKHLDGIVADDFAQFLFRERILAVLSFIEIDFFGLQETSCFATSRSSRFVNEFYSVRHVASLT
jgi:hypothetical protein